MQRITITIEDDLLAEIDAAAKARGYQNRSEIIRDLARAGLQQGAEDAAPSGQCVAALVYVYDHNARQLSKRLADTFHDHHEMSLATMHSHLDNDSCMEVTILRGKTGKVQHFAEHVIAERGVRHGRLVLVPTDMLLKPHSHDEHEHDHPHPHTNPSEKRKQNPR
jgi:CopG family nickel-responsive transcriptional regulator